MQLSQIDVTGCKITGPITPIGQIGPKHHAIIIGHNHKDDQIYVAESMHYGYQIDTYDNFINRYSSNGEVCILENDGKHSDLLVAQRALDEIKSGGRGIYNLITNNCESFANRAIS